MVGFNICFDKDLTFIFISSFVTVNEYLSTFPFQYLLFTMILVTFSVVVTIGVLNVNFRTPATHKMAPWVRKAFIDFLPRYLFIQQSETEPENEDPPAELNAGRLLIIL